MQFQPGGSVFQRVVLTEHGTGQLAGLADGEHADLRDHRGGGAEQKSAGLETGDQGGVGRGGGQCPSHVAQRARIGQHGGEVAEQHTGLREVLLHPDQSVQ